MGISTIEHSVVGVGESGTGMLIAAIGDSENRPVPVETTMSTPSLPPEILDLIVGHLCDKTALKTCCIVSKSWVNLTVYRTYACVPLYALTNNQNRRASHPLTLALPRVQSKLADYSGCDTIKSRAFVFSHSESHQPRADNPVQRMWRFSP